MGQPRDVGQGQFSLVIEFRRLDPNGFSDVLSIRGGIQNSVIGATSITGLQEIGNFSVLPRWGSIALIRSPLNHPRRDELWGRWAQTTGEVRLKSLARNELSDFSWL